MHLQPEFPLHVTEHSRVLVNVDIFRGSLFSIFTGQTILMSANQSKQGYQKVCIWPCHQALGGERAMFGLVTGKQGSHPQTLIESWERENSELTKLYGEACFSVVKSFLETQNSGVFLFLNCYCLLGTQVSGGVQYCHCHMIEKSQVQKEKWRGRIQRHWG